VLAKLRLKYFNYLNNKIMFKLTKINKIIIISISVCISILLLLVVFMLYKNTNNNDNDTSDNLAGSKIQLELLTTNPSIKQLCEYIKNQITITQPNMFLFANHKEEDNKILLECAMKYNHGDIIKLLQLKNTFNKT